MTPKIPDHDRCVRYRQPPLTLRHKRWCLYEDWRIMFPPHWEFTNVQGTRMRGLMIGSPFYFDLASVPRVFWPIVAPHELTIAAPLCHDYLYRIHMTTRRQADKLFRYIMRCEDIGWLRRWVAWLAVRVFGVFAWRR